MEPALLANRYGRVGSLSWRCVRPPRRRLRRHLQVDRTGVRRETRHIPW